MGGMGDMEMGGIGDMGFFDDFGGGEEFKPDRASIYMWHLRRSETDILTK